MKLACLHAGRLLERRQSGLSSADGLELEEHLASCVSCRAEANLLQGLRSLSAKTPSVLDERARQRAIAGAFSQSALTPVMGRTSQARRTGLLLSAAAAACLCAWIGARALRTTEVPAVATPAPTAAGDRVLSGQIEVAGSSFSAGQTLPTRVQLKAAGAASLALAHAQVALRAGSEAGWDAAARRLSLPQGSALIEVDPARRQSFEVVTKAFVVAVLGTRFEVTQSSVYVLRGRVSVTPTAGIGDATPVVLTADSDHTRFELPPPSAAERAPTPQREHVAEKPARAPHPSAAELLDRARAQLAARQQDQARSTLKLAEPLLHDAAARAQALSLEAECELQARKFASARDTYLQVWQRFPKLPAAETALFAAARLEADHGQAAAAATLFTRYLANYPSGSFAREAKLRLGQLQRDGATESKQ